MWRVVRGQVPSRRKQRFTRSALERVGHQGVSAASLLAGRPLVRGPPVDRSCAQPKQSTAATTVARMFRSIMRSAALPSSASICATASAGTVTSKWRT